MGSSSVATWLWSLFRRSLVAAVTGNSTGWAAGFAADRNLTTDEFRNASCHRDRYLSRHTFCAGRHASFTHLATFGVWNLASTRLLDHSTAGIRNLLCDTVRNHAALCVRNLLRDTVVRPRAGRVWNPFGTSFPDHGAGRVRNLFGTGMSGE